MDADRRRRVEQDDPHLGSFKSLRVAICYKQHSLISTEHFSNLHGQVERLAKDLWKRDEYWEAPEIVDAVIDDLDELPSTIRNLA